MAANPDCFVSILKIYLTKRNHLQSKTKVACMHEFIKISEWIGGFCPKSVMASNLHTKCVNFHQNHIFHSCNTCIFALVQVNLCRKLFILQNMGRTCCVQKLFWISETILLPRYHSALFHLFHGPIAQIYIDHLSDPENKKCSLWKVFGIHHPQTPSRRGSN